MQKITLNDVVTYGILEDWCVTRPGMLRMHSRGLVCYEAWGVKITHVNAVGCRRRASLLSFAWPVVGF
jgi:hypothetical protein